MIARDKDRFSHSVHNPKASCYAHAWRDVQEQIEVAEARASMSYFEQARIVTQVYASIFPFRIAMSIAWLVPMDTCRLQVPWRGAGNALSSQGIAF